MVDEFERTYLAKSLPADLTDHPVKEILDIYIPASAAHPTLRIRKNGERYEMTKKQPVDDADYSHQTEHTISLTAAEWQDLAQLPGKRVRKLRYQYPYQGITLEFDLFQDDLAGLVEVDAEFTSKAASADFTMPEYCLADVTQETFLAGGMLCGKSYADIADDLARYNYQPIKL